MASTMAGKARIVPKFRSAILLSQSSAWTTTYAHTDKDFSDTKEINRALGENSISEDMLKNAFDAWWHKLENKLKNLSPKKVQVLTKSPEITPKSVASKPTIAETPKKVKIKVKPKVTVRKKQVK